MMLINMKEYNLKDPEQILDTLQLIGIIVPDREEYSEPAISLVFNCNWDKGNGCLPGGRCDRGSRNARDCVVMQV